jgi:hypothetical protein
MLNRPSSCARKFYTKKTPQICPTRSVLFFGLSPSAYFAYLRLIHIVCVCVYVMYINIFLHICMCVCVCVCVCIYMYVCMYTYTSVWGVPKSSVHMCCVCEASGKSDV